MNPITAIVSAAFHIASALHHPSSMPSMVRDEAVSQGVPAPLALGVATVESGFNPHKTGGVGEVGLMQIRPQTARAEGYRGSIKHLYDPRVNAHWAIRYLHHALRVAHGDQCKAAGLKLYNEAVLVTSVGSLPVRVKRQFESGRKLGKTHQNCLVFVKGDAKKAAQACGGADGN